MWQLYYGEVIVSAMASFLYLIPSKIVEYEDIGD